MGACKKMATKMMFGESLNADEKKFLMVNDPKAYYRIYGGSATIGTKNPTIQLELFSVPQATESPEFNDEMENKAYAEWINEMELLAADNEEMCG